MVLGFLLTLNITNAQYVDYGYSNNCGQNSNQYYYGKYNEHSYYDYENCYDYNSYNSDPYYGASYTPSYYAPQNTNVYYDYGYAYPAQAQSNSLVNNNDVYVPIENDDRKTIAIYKPILAVLPNATLSMSLPRDTVNNIINENTILTINLNSKNAKSCEVKNKINGDIYINSNTNIANFEFVGKMSPSAYEIVATCYEEINGNGRSVISNVLQFVVDCNEGRVLVNNKCEVKVVNNNNPNTNTGNQSTNPLLNPVVNNVKLETFNIGGFKVLVNKDSLSKPEINEGGQILEKSILELSNILTPDQLSKLKNVPIYVEYKLDPVGAVVYHLDANWLVANGYIREMAKSVEITNIKNFIQNTKDKQPYILLHELSHAYYDLYLTTEQKNKIITRYADAVRSGIYNNVKHANGASLRHYGISSEAEFFPEFSEAYLGTNDYYPFTRADLKSYDIETYNLMKEVWGDR